MDSATLARLLGKGFLACLITLVLSVVFGFAQAPWSCALPSGSSMSRADLVRLGWCTCQDSPSCTCQDSDNDGFCDSWEIAGGIDLNADGKLKEEDDLLLPTVGEVIRKHRLFPPRGARIEIRPGCSAASKPIAPGQSGDVSVALLGADDFDVTQVDPASLKFAGAPPLHLQTADVNRDGKPDLTAVFDMAKVKLHPNAKLTQLTGWLKNSQAFTGEGAVIVVPSMAWETTSCRN